MLKGLILLTPRLFQDQRGYFLESYRQDSGLSFVQDNISFSVKNTIRGLHYQVGPGQAKLVQCLSGSILDIAVDIRPDSPTFGQYEAVELSNVKQLYIPIGFAHGFCVLSDTALVHYKVSSYYDPQLERSIRWNDPTLNIQWPVQDPILSDKDRSASFFLEALGV
jgi:dTDP-4-dehydrorhamnose 3,5-epimerase